jgi:hypothetical protein
MVSRQGLDLFFAEQGLPLNSLWFFLTIADLVHLLACDIFHRSVIFVRSPAGQMNVEKSDGFFLLSRTALLSLF